MMDQEDERVKELQKCAWGLQSISNKPGGRCPEKVKGEAYKLASRAISLCSDVAYTEEADFVERSKVFYKQIEAKKKEVTEAEEAEKQKLVGKCYRAAPGGAQYTVGTVTDRSAASRAIADSNSGRALSSTAGGARALTAGEVASRLAEDPEALFLCDLSLGDSDVEPLCQGLQRAGANLTSLDISHNLLADVGVQKLVSALATGACPKLKELHIGCNSFGDLGAKMLTGGLAALRRDLVVHLDTNGGQGLRSESVATATSCADLERSTPTVEASSGANLDRPAAPQEIAQELAPLPGDTEACAPAQLSADSPGSYLRCPAAPETSMPEVQAAVAPPPAAAPGRDALCVDLVKASCGEGFEVRAVLSLPEGIDSAGDLDVDVSAWRIVARSISGVLIADAALPCAVIADTAQAVFSRKRRTMTIKLHPEDPVAAATAHGA